MILQVCNWLQTGLLKFGETPGSKVRWENEAKAISLEEMYGNWQLRRLPRPSSNNCRLVI